MRLSERWKYLKQLRRYWLNQPGVQVVKVGYERYGAQSDIEHMEEMMLIDGDHFPIEELNSPREGGHSKDERIKRLQPDHENWRFFYPLPKGQGYTKTQNQVILRGEGYLLPKEIKHKDENGRAYDVVEKFFENEYQFFPNTTYKDFFDAMSRIYDMNPVPPVVYSDEDLLPEVAED